MSTAVVQRYSYDDVRSFLGTRTKQITDVSGGALSPARVIQLSVLCCYQNRRLLECDQGSFIASVIQACSLGLDLSLSSGEGYLIPYWNKDTKSYQCRFQTGYQGVVKLACESGKVNYVHARVVHAHDDFEWRWEPELQLIHAMSRDGRRGHATHGYAVARLASGELVGECMTVEEIEKIRACSQQPDGWTWQEHWDEMAKKTAARRLCKWLPKTPKLIEALETIDADFDWTERTEKSLGFTVPIEINGQVETPSPPPAAASVPASAPTQEVPVPAPPKADRITARLAARAMAQASGNGGAVAPETSTNGHATVNGVATEARAESRPPLPGGEGARRAGEGVPTADRMSPAAAAAHSRDRPGRTSSPRRAPVASSPITPIAGRDLDAFCVSHRCGEWFAGYGKTRGFPTPVSTWSNAQVKRAWDQYQYEIEIGTLQSA